jgi:putative hydrolase of HD superfamily
MNDRLKTQIQFLMEIDKLKLIQRQTRLLADPERRENDAEHSWHLALYVMILMEYADAPNLNWLKVLKLVLIHDLVEIYAGDTFIYDEKAQENQYKKELEAAHRLFSLLPIDQADEFHALWQEFETQNTAEAKFAKVVDRMQPFVHNYFSDGGTWHLPGASKGKEVKAMSVIVENSKILGEFISEAIEDAVRTGKLKDVELAHV